MYLIKDVNRIIYDPKFTLYVNIGTFPPQYKRNTGAISNINFLV